jgi:hypothetical protein
VFVLATSSPSLWKVCCGSGSHGLEALVCAIRRQAPICHLRLCPRSLQCVPWTWASPHCVSLHMTEETSPFLIQVFLVEPFYLTPTSKHSGKHPVPSSLGWAGVPFLPSVRHHFIPSSHTMNLGVFIMFNQ